MPEMPEVETIVRGLREQLASEEVCDVQVRWARSIDRPSVEEFAAQLVGCTIVAVGRRGKFVIMTLTSGYLLVHLRMTGLCTF